MIGELIGINLTIGVDLVDLVFICFGGIIGYVLLFLRWDDDRKWVLERDQIKDCRKKGLPWNITAHPGTGNAITETGAKIKKDDIVYKSKDFGRKVDADFNGRAEPLRLPKGLTINIFSSTHSFAMGLKEIISRPQMIQYVRDHYAILDFMSDEELVACIDTSRDHMGNDFTNYVEKYAPVDGMGEPIGSNELVTLFTQIQDELADIPTQYNTDEGEPRPALILTALRTIPSAFMSQSFYQVELLLDRRAQLKNQNPEMKLMYLMTFGIVALMILVGGAVALNYMPI